MRRANRIVVTTLSCAGLFLGVSAMAAPQVNGSMWCGVDANYSSAEITWDANTVRVEVENPLGFAAMPQFEAPVSLSMVPSIQAQSKDLEGLGSGFTYQWDRKKCTWSDTDQWLLSCEGIAATPEGDNGVQALLMTTARIDETSLSSTQSTLRLRFILSKGGTYFVALPFPLTKCQISSGPAPRFLAHNQLEPGMTTRKPTSNAPKK